MYENQFLSKLQLKELHFLLHQVRLGVGNLQNKFDDKTFKSFCNSIYINNKHFSKIYPGVLEKHAQIMLLINALITGIFGAWLGMAGLMQNQLVTNYHFPFVIIGIAIVASVGLYYLRYRQNSEQAKKIVSKQKLKYLQYDILIIINQRQKERLERVSNGLGKYFNSLSAVVGIPYPNIDMLLETPLAITTNLLDIVRRWDVLIKKQQILANNNEDLFRKYSKLEEIISGLVDYLSLDENKSAQIFKQRESYKFYVEKLMAAEDKNKVMPLRFWLKKNAKSIITDAIPTVVGSLASIFVYLNGFPQIIKELFHYNVSVADGKYQMFGVVVLTTIILSLIASFLYQIKRNAERHREDNLIMAKISQQENLLFKNIYLMCYLKHIKKQLHKITVICDDVVKFEIIA